MNEARPPASGRVPVDPDAQTPIREPGPSPAATEAVLAVWAQKGVRNRYPVVGNSMLPLIREGDVALVEHGTRGIGTGTIILFRSGPGLTLHRVLGQSRGMQDVSYRAKGDNAPEVDDVSSRDLIGRVLAIERQGAHLRLDTRLWRVLGWLIAIAAQAQFRAASPDAADEGRPQGAGGAPGGRWLRPALCLLVRAARKAAVALGARWRPGTVPSRLEHPGAADP